jgi:hypothetical protein
VTFVDWRDLQRWKLINDALGLGQPEPAETYSTSEHLYTELSIPPGATGTLPRAMRARAGLAAEAEEDLGETGRTRSRRSSARTRSKSGRSRDGAATRENAGARDASDATGAGRADAPARTRRRRRTRGGREVSGDAAREVIREIIVEVPAEKTTQQV